MSILPRLIRVRDAPAYLGMDRLEFNLVVRPHLTEIPIGKQGKAFDRHDLDAWADWHKQTHGREPTRVAADFDLSDNVCSGDRPIVKYGGRRRWVTNEVLDSKGAMAAGTSTSGSEAMGDFRSRLALTISRKRNAT